MDRPQLLKCLDCPSTKDVLGEVRLASIVKTSLQIWKWFSQLTGIGINNRIKEVTGHCTVFNGVFGEMHSLWTDTFLPMFPFPLLIW